MSGPYAHKRVYDPERILHSLGLPLSFYIGLETG